MDPGVYPSSSVSGLVARIDRGAIHDGPGLRTVVFLKGCPLRCGWCHSPETQSPRPEVLIHGDRCLTCEACAHACEQGGARPATSGNPVDRHRCLACGRCVAACPAGARALSGTPLTATEVVREVLKDRAFYDQSGGGMTLSGGEPLMQAEFSLSLLEIARREGLHTAVETCGHVKPHVLRLAAAMADLLLFDLKLMEDARHRLATRVSNRVILDNLRTVARLRRDIIVRLPLVPGVNDDWRNLSATAAFVDALGLSRIDVLPYHRAGVAKYQRLGRAYAMERVGAPSDESLGIAVDTMARAGLDVRVGGSA